MLLIKYVLNKQWKFLTQKMIIRKFENATYINLSPQEIIKQKQSKSGKRRRDDVLYMPHNPKPIGDVVKRSFFKRADKGLYANCCIQFGNNVPKSKHKTRRKWLPNIQKKLIYSKALDTYIQLKVSTRALRTITKVGGLDEYVTGNKSARLKELGLRGWELREMVLSAKKYKESLKNDLKDEKLS